jgi:hypothetical protein
MRKTTKNPTEKLRKKCVSKAKKIATSKGICEYCGRRRVDGWQMHGSHIFAEGIHRAMSGDVDNILCLCAKCHIGGFWKNAKDPSWHEDPAVMMDWFITNYPERWAILKERAKLSPLCDLIYWEKKLEDLN